MNDAKASSGPQKSTSGVNIGKLINKYGAEKQSKGLSDLLKLGNTEAPISAQNPAPNTDHMMLSEILRILNDGKKDIHGRFDSFEEEIRNKQMNKKSAKAFFAVFLAGVCFGALILGKSEQKPLALEQVKQTKVVTLEEQSKKLMVTSKFVNLRNLNSPDAKKLTTIAPAQTVEVLGRKGGWIHISYHNNLSGESFKGYVWEEFLSHIKLK